MSRPTLFFISLAIISIFFHLEAMSSVPFDERRPPSQQVSSSELEGLLNKVLPPIYIPNLRKKRLERLISNFGPRLKTFCNYVFENRPDYMFVTLPNPYSPEAEILFNYFFRETPNKVVPAELYPSRPEQTPHPWNQAGYVAGTGMNLDLLEVFHSGYNMNSWIKAYKLNKWSLDKPNTDSFVKFINNSRFTPNSVIIVPPYLFSTEHSISHTTHNEFIKLSQLPASEIFVTVILGMNEKISPSDKNTCQSLISNSLLQLPSSPPISRAWQSEEFKKKMIYNCVLQKAIKRCPPFER